MEHRSGQDIEISTHAPAGGATLTPDAVCSGVIFLLTPLREGRRSATRRLFPVFVISTHAPAGGATLRYHPCGNPGAISTHAPAGGATHAELVFDLPAHISTHAPAGGATRVFPKSEKSHYISTHAPAGGATQGNHALLREPRDFYSRPCGRGDIAASRTFPPSFHFYSRPCGRGDK